MLNCIQQHHLQSHSNELTNGLHSECLMMRSLHRWLYVHTVHQFMIFVFQFFGFHFANFTSKFCMTTGVPCILISMHLFQFHFGKIFQKFIYQHADFVTILHTEYTMRSQFLQGSLFNVHWLFSKMLHRSFSGLAAFKTFILHEWINYVFHALWILPSQP